MNSATSSSSFRQQEEQYPAGEFAPVSQTGYHEIGGDAGSVPTHLDVPMNPQMVDLQRDSLSDSSIGALGGLPLDQNSDDEFASVDEMCVEEIKKLDEDFKKNLMRAKKVFVNRMDNLQRTQVQREAQHKKTLEQHQKDRAAFEKRLQQEEIEQNRRIEQMQKEWDRRREEVRLKQQSDEKSLSSTPPTFVGGMAMMSGMDTTNSSALAPGKGGSGGEDDANISDR